MIAMERRASKPTPPSELAAALAKLKRTCLALMAETPNRLMDRRRGLPCPTGGSSLDPEAHNGE